MKKISPIPLLGISFLGLFILLGSMVKLTPQWLQSFDTTITKLVKETEPAFTPYFLFITKLANPLVLITLFLFTALLFFIKKKYLELIWLSSGTILISGLLNPFIKLFFARMRPTIEHLVTEHSYSFPSGHSTGSMVFYGTLIYLLPAIFKSTTLQNIFKVILGLLILNIGISRIYLGVHFPSDVLGGYCLGVSWLLLTYPYYKAKKKQSLLQK